MGGPATARPSRFSAEPGSIRARLGACDDIGVAKAMTITLNAPPLVDASQE
jgi:hypothetical protein